jgi:amidohydrolase
MINFQAEAQAEFEYTRSLRRDFHQHPELGFQEFRTAGIVARELSTLGLEIATGIAETGVVALIEGTQPGPVLLLRFDMDALPVEEQTGVEYSSQTPGVMHACGHDGHTAIGLTVARLLQRHRQELAGTVKLIFQPAEEGLGGAERMVAEGILDSPRPNLCLALHLWNELPIGTFAFTPGPFLAASETFSITLHGRGGHGAMPHLTVDPVISAAQLITGLQSIVSRQVNPLDSAVISVTSIHAGHTFNVIPNQVALQGTIRTFRPEVRQFILERFRDLTLSLAVAMGCEAEIDLKSITPAVVNDTDLTQQAHQIARTTFPEHEILTNYQTTVSEDMAFMMQVIPGCYFFVGSQNAALGLNATHHHPRFNFDEQALMQASAVMSATAAQLLQRNA